MDAPGRDLSPALDETEFHKSHLIVGVNSELLVAPSAATDVTDVTTATVVVDVVDNTVVDKTIEHVMGAKDGQERVKVTIGPQHFDLLKLIGEGAFGKVIMVRNRLDRKMYAMKVISKKLLKKKNNVSYMKSERDILTKIDHPFIVQLWFAFQSEKKLFLVMDFLSGGELFFHLKRRGLIMEHEVRFYLAEMVLAIEFLHGCGIVHRDLKPENVLLRADAHVCITDFGLAKEIGDLESARTLCGTSEYMAPEMLTRNGYGKGVDWWSLGALCYEMLVGKAPFVAKSQKDLDRKILSEKLSCPSYLTANAHSLLKGMLDKDLNKRLGASKSTMFSLGGVAALKRHAFFEDLDWAALQMLQLEPPIDLSVAYEAPPGSATKTIPANPRASGGGNALHEADDVDMNDLTKHFHEGFTGQQISLSVLEDSMSLSTPGRSRANSPTPTERSDHDGALYDDFDFVGFNGGSFECTVEQVRQFEEDLANKSAKMMKKKKLKEKKDRERAIKEQEEKRLQEAEGLNQQRREEEEKKRLEEEQRRAQIAVRREARRQAQLLRQQRLRDMHAAIAAHDEKVEKVQKKLKNLRKKLRDITELEGKVASGAIAVLNTEQQEKVGKKQEVEDDIREMEDEEEELEDSRPPAVPAELLEDDADDDAGDAGAGEDQTSQGQGEKERALPDSDATLLAPPKAVATPAVPASVIPTRTPTRPTPNPTPTPTPTPTTSAVIATAQRAEPRPASASSLPAPAVAAPVGPTSPPPVKPATVPWRSPSVAAKLTAAAVASDSTSATAPSDSAHAGTSSGGLSSGGSASAGSWRSVAATGVRPTDNRLPPPSPSARVNANNVGAGISVGVGRPPTASPPVGSGLAASTAAATRVPAPAPANAPAPAVKKAAIVADDWATVASTKKKRGQ